MRLFLIPISTRQALIYSRPLRKNAPKELSLLDRVTTKAATTWAEWEEADKGWKKHLVTWGNKVQQRIPYQEWGLKSIPSLTAQRRMDETHGNKKIELLFPGNAVKEDKLRGVLQTIATERQELHRRRFLWSAIVAPLTAPAALIPVYAQTIIPLLDAVDWFAEYRISPSSTSLTERGHTGEVSLTFLSSSVY